MSDWKIDLVVYDFDGVMTDNRAILMQDGSEGVFVSRADGMGIEAIRGLGILQLIISTETNPVVQARAEKLRIEAITGCRDKRTALQHYCHSAGIQLGNTAFIGNDLNDLAAMGVVGYPVAPSDAHARILSVAKLVTEAKGGGGVVREFADYLSATRSTDPESGG